MAHLETAQLLHLVLDQRAQWRDHHGDPGDHEGRQLIAEALAATRGHQDEAVPAQNRRVDGLELVGPKLLQPEHLYGLVRC